MRVALAMSGGIDSTLAAYLLKREGYTVIGCTMQIWDAAPDSLSSPTNATMRSGCYGPGAVAELKRAATTAKRLGIEHHIIPLTSEYKSLVLEYYRQEYLAGRTPNPCMICNQQLKFNLLPQRLQAMGVEFDAYATGHYARVTRNPNTDLHTLWRGMDRKKDQSYFLFLLNQNQLSNLILPLGNLNKSTVFALARDYGFSDLMAIPESQDFADKSIRDQLFACDHIQPGPILDDTGRELGRHRGLAYYTIGQREGLGLSLGYPVYIKELRPENNTIIVAKREAVMDTSCRVTDINWIAGAPPTDSNPVTATAPLAPFECDIQLRYRHTAAPAQVQLLRHDQAQVTFNAPQFAVTPGQAAVFYRANEVLGGGWIAR